MLKSRSSSAEDQEKIQLVDRYNLYKDALDKKIANIDGIENNLENFFLDSTAERELVEERRGEKLLERAERGVEYIGQLVEEGENLVNNPGRTSTDVDAWIGKMKQANRAYKNLDKEFSRLRRKNINKENAKDIKLQRKELEKEMKT